MQSASFRFALHPFLPHKHLVLPIYLYEILTFHFCFSSTKYMELDPASFFMQSHTILLHSSAFIPNRLHTCRSHDLALRLFAGQLGPLFPFSSVEKLAGGNPWLGQQNLLRKQNQANKGYSNCVTLQKWGFLLLSQTNTVPLRNMFARAGVTLTRITL